MMVKWTGSGIIVPGFKSHLDHSLLCVDKLLNVSEPQFSHLKNEEKMDIKSLPWGTVLMTAIDFDMHKRGQTDGWIERRINM